MNNKLQFIPAVAAALTLAACASIGRPEGGPRDTEQPVYVSSNPAPGELNVSRQKVSIFFNENVQLDDPISRAAISPAQKTAPRITANGRRVDIELEDTLLPNTTYTIDLADAVKDLNEGNVLDGFAIDFSTGSSIDTLSISGMVLQARNLEPAQGMLVGVYASPEDSCIMTTRFSRIARTNQLGQFTVRNLPAGEYQLFALNDLNRDMHWDRTEDVAFYSGRITPTVEVVRTDSDSVATIRFMPDNLLLTWFNEDFRSQYLKDYKRSERNILHIEMGAPSDSLPQLNIVGVGQRSGLRVPIEDVAVMMRNEKADTLDYWLTDSALIAADTLIVETRYRRMDSLDRIVWHTDTLKFNMRRRGNKPPYKALTLQEKIDSVLAKSDTAIVDTFALMQPTKWLDITTESNTLELNGPLRFSATTPIARIDTAGLRLEWSTDSVWHPVEPRLSVLAADSISLRKFKLDGQWTPGAKYRLTVDSMAIADVYGVYNKPMSMELTARRVDEYSNIVFNISGIPDSVQAVVELLNGKDAPVCQRPVEGGRVTFDYLLPETYYARLFIDADGNGKWTNGNLLNRRQPEDVYYFPKKLTLKKNWDRNEAWDINALSPEIQKPEDIKTNKPRPKAGELPEQNPNDDEEEEDSEGFGTNHFNPNNRNNSFNRNARF